MFIAMLKNKKMIDRSIDRLNSELEVLNHHETGVKGINYTITPSSTNVSLKALKRLEIIDRIEEIEKEIELLEMMNAKTNELLSMMPEDLQTMLLEKFIKGMTYEQMARKYNYSPAGVWMYLERETKKYLC